MQCSGWRSLWSLPWSILWSYYEFLKLRLLARYWRYIKRLFQFKLLIWSHSSAIIIVAEGTSLSNLQALAILSTIKYKRSWNLWCTFLLHPNTVQLKLKRKWSCWLKLNAFCTLHWSYRSLCPKSNRCGFSLWLLLLLQTFVDWAKVNQLLLAFYTKTQWTMITEKSLVVIHSSFHLI
jgi:hypothetical protein